MIYGWRYWTVKVMTNVAFGLEYFIYSLQHEADNMFDNISERKKVNLLEVKETSYSQILASIAQCINRLT